MNTYHVVHRFSRAEEDWVIDGIYSKSEDAHQCADEIVSAGAQFCHVLQLTHDELVQRLTDKRIGAIADAIKGLLP